MSGITTRDWIRSLVRVGALVAVMAAGAVLFLPAYWYIWGALVVGGVLLVVNWHARNFAYRCGRCGQAFAISTLTDLTSPNGMTRKYLKCPKCRERSWAVIIKRSEL